MTVSSTIRKEDFVLDQIENEFDFTFKALAVTDIKCLVTVSSTDYPLVYDVDYTVVLENEGDGGSVILTDPAAVSIGTLTIYRDTINKQESDYEDYNQFPAETLEADIDRRTLVEQELKETMDRTITFPITSPTTGIEFPEPEAENVIGWDSAGVALRNYSREELGIGTIPRVYTWVIDSPAVGGVPGPRLTEENAIVRLDSFVVGGTSIAFNIEERDTIGSAGTDILDTDQVTTTAGTTATTFGNTTLDVGNWLWVDISDVTGTVTKLTVCLSCEV